ncbi:MAG TPA: Cache 3/Cache 2 fusion domain-containing protein, partial [Pseudothermotoga sp.]|nr:Cache 3/Cache 2 fusion domain-containing protein [Pseudothermotoga sp.]
MKPSLKFYGILLVFLILAVALIPFGLTAVKQNEKTNASISNQMYENMLNGAIEVLKEYVRYEYGSLRLQDSQLVDKDGKPIKDRFDVVDKISKQMNVVATIFQVQGDDFLRISTSIRKNDGSRAVGTFLGKDSAAYKPIMQKQRYLGQAKILGKDYATGYDPILDEKGNLVGILFVGVPQEQVNAIILQAKDNFVKTTTIMTAILSVVTFLIGYSFVGIILIKPFADISQAIAKISQGDLTYKTTTKFKSKEFIKLSQDLSEMIDNFSSMIKEISRTSDEVSRSSQSLSSLAQEVSATSEELSSQMEEVNKSAQNASASIQEVTSGIEEVAASAQNVSKSAQGLTEKASEVNNAAK